MLASPFTRITTGVLAVFLLKVTVTPSGIVKELKLKTPLSGRSRRVSTLGEKAPSAPVLPLSKARTNGLVNREELSSDETIAHSILAFGEADDGGAEAWFGSDREVGQG